MRKTTDEQRLEIVKLYKDGTSCIQLGKRYGITPGAVSSLLKTRGIEVKKNQYKARKYQLNENYFDKIDTEEKAYFLGLLYADGCNFPKNRVVTISLLKGDEDILNRLNNLIYINRPLYNNGYTSTLTICSKKISDQLERLGCVPQKSLKLEFPTLKQLPDCLMRHFIRGYFDGDGCIYLNLKRNQNAVVNITSSTLFSVGLKEYLKSILDVNFNLQILKKNNKTATIQMNGNLQVKKFLDWLYEDSSIFLQRKYAKYQEVNSFLLNRVINHNNKYTKGRIAKKNIQRNG